jgi:hypothetical protein
MLSVKKHYQNRQADYTDRFDFDFRWEPDKRFYTIWCVGHPPDPHQKGEPIHHLGKNGLLCQRQGHESRTFEQAEAFALWWAERWSIYVRTGGFPMTRGKVSVPDR